MSLRQALTAFLMVFTMSIASLTSSSVSTRPILFAWSNSDRNIESSAAATPRQYADLMTGLLCMSGPIDSAAHRLYLMAHLAVNG